METVVLVVDLPMIVVDLPTYDMVWDIDFFEQFGPEVMWRKRKMRIRHGGKVHTFASYEDEMPDSSPYFPICSFHALGQAAVCKDPILGFDGVVMACLAPMDACDVGASDLTDPLLAGKGGYHQEV